jgi:hypothetical protein
LFLESRFNISISTIEIDEKDGLYKNFLHKIYLKVVLILCVCVFLQQFEWLVGTQYKPMELTKSDWASIRKSPPWAIDSWGLGEHI